jgi:TP901 family phage tail tape measure protein
MASAEELILRISQQGGQNTERQLRSIRDVIRDYARQANQSSIKSLTFAQGLQQVSQSLGNVGRNLTNYVTKNLIKVATGSIATAATFEQGMSRVKAVTGATGKDFTTLEKLALKMGKSTSKTATEAAQAIEYMGLAGWNTKQIQEGLEPVLRASEAGMMDLGLTSDLVTDSMSALGIGTKDLTRYLNIGAKAQNSSNQSMQQFLEAMVTAGGSFKMFNVPLEEAGGLLSVLANRGYKGSEAGNALISIMNNLTTGTGKAGEAMGELGIEIYDGNGKFRGMTKILGEMNQKFKGMTEEQKNTYIQMIGGKTRTKELNALLNGQSKELSDVTKKLYDSKGALSDMAKTMQDNLIGEWTKFKSAIEGVAISIGSAFLPYLRQGVKWLMGLANAFNDMGSGGKIMVGIIAAIAAAIGPLLLLFAGLGSLVANIVIAWTFLAPVISSIGAPIIAVVGAIALLIPALTALILSSEKVRDGIGNAFNSIKEKVGGAISFMKTHIDDIKTAFQGFFNFLTSGNFDSSFESMKNALKNMFPNHAKTIDDIILKFVMFRQKVINIREALIDFGSKVMKILSPIGDMLKQTFSKIDVSAMFQAFEGIKQAIIPLLPILKGLAIVVGTVLAAAFGIVIGAINGILRALPNLIGVIAAVIGTIISLVTTVLNMIVALFTGNWEKVDQSVAKLWENIKNIFINAGLAVWNLVGGFIDGIIKFFVNLWDTLVGHSIIPDMVNAIINWFKNLWNSAKNIFSNIVSSIVNKVNSIKNRAVSIFNSMISGISNILNALRSIASNAFNKVVSAISAKISAAKSAASRVATAAKTALKKVVSGVYTYGKNMIQNLVDGILSKLGAVKRATKKVVGAIKDFLGFESPTKEGPGKTADKWAPNLVNMFNQGLEDGINKIKSVSARLATEINFVPQQGMIYPSAGTSVNNNSVAININGARMSTDEIGRAVVGALQTYGIRPQKG